MAGDGIMDGFIAAAGSRYAVAQKKIQDNASKPSMSSVGASIFEAIYQFGRGKADASKDRLIAGARATEMGQRYEATAQADAVRRYMPIIVGGAVLLVVVGSMMGKKG